MFTVILLHHSLTAPIGLLLPPLAWDMNRSLGRSGTHAISWNDDRFSDLAGLGHFYFQGTGGIAYAVGPVKLRAELGWASIRLGAAIGF